MHSTDLIHHWNPIATQQQVGERPRRLTLLGEDLVAFRTDEGVSVFFDLCIYRGVALSLGLVEEGILHCGYHGWAYDGAGACVEIPLVAEGLTDTGQGTSHRLPMRGALRPCVGGPRRAIGRRPGIP